MNLPEIFGKKGAKYALKTVIYISLGPPDPTQQHLGPLSQILHFTANQLHALFEN